MSDNLPSNRKDVLAEDIIVKDSRGHELTHYVLAERLLQVEYFNIMNDTVGGTASNTLIYILEGGFRGFHKYTKQELLDEWAEVEEKFWTLLDDGDLHWEPYEDDPLASLPKEVEGHPV